MSLSTGRLNQVINLLHMRDIALMVEIFVTINFSSIVHFLDAAPPLVVAPSASAMVSQ